MQGIVNIEEPAIDYLFQWSAAAVTLSAVKMYRYRCYRGISMLELQMQII